MTKKFRIVCFLSLSLGMTTVHHAYAQAQQTYNSTSQQIELWRTTEWKILGVPTKYQKDVGSCSISGQQTYDTTNNRMVFCDGAKKYSLTCANSKIGCGGFTGQQRYDAANDVFSYCNGTHWIYMGSVADLPCCPQGFVPVPKNVAAGTTRDFCVSKYHMKAVHNGTNAPADGINLGNSGAYYAESRAANTPWTGVDLQFAIDTCDDLNKAGVPGNFHLITNAEWMTIAYSIENNPQNWSGSSVGAGHLPTGHSDGSCIDSPSGCESGQNFLAAPATDADPCWGTHNSNCVTKSHIDFWQKRTFVLGNDYLIWDMAGNVNSWVDTGDVPLTLNGSSLTAPERVYQLNDTPSLNVYPSMTPFLFPIDPKASTNRFAFLPEHDFGTNHYDQMGLGTIRFENFSDAGVFRGGKFDEPRIHHDPSDPYPDTFDRHFGPGEWERRGGIYSAWIWDKDASLPDVGFRCTYIPEN